MKNSRTMCELARATALGKGPRKIGRVIGFFLTQEELEGIYLRNGFNPKRRTMESHIEAWKKIGDAKTFTVGSTEAVFFLMGDEFPASRTEIARIKTVFPDAEDTTDPGVLIA